MRKSATDTTDRELAHRAEQELQRLSLISFGMLNRRRQWLTAAEAERDLTALLGPSEGARDGFRASLGQGEIALGRFFFVQRAQAVRDEQRLATFEFLHATFGEYLVARLSVQLLEGLLDQRPALAVGRSCVDDDLLYVLLSYATLSSRQILRFAGARISRIPPGDRERLGELLLTVMAEHRNRTEHRYTDYRPAVRATSSRHGLYSANLLMLTVRITGGVRASELFPGVEKPAALWNRRVLLWRAAFREAEWTDFALALGVRQIWGAGGLQDLHIRPLRGLLPPPEPMDVFWLYGRRPAEDHGGGPLGWVRSDPEQLRHKMSVSGGTNDSIVLHTVDPFLSRLPSAVTGFIRTSAGATSMAHALTSLWLAGGLGAPEQELVELYEHCAAFLAPWSGFDAGTLQQVTRLVLGQLVTDAPRLPAEAVAMVLNAPDVRLLDPECLELRTRAALAALRRDEGSAVAGSCVHDTSFDLAAGAPARLLTLWWDGLDTPWERLLRPAVLQVAARPSDEDLVYGPGGEPGGVPSGLLARVREALDERPL
ncbi:hypothetical protein ACFYT4_16325 [Streptomyces sp. NPDC004609]|uniref:hypothetical protein n=1 Tax=Streptomyces sp. NPDC004609 TaxID=3364704 RepID=UPI0036D1F221